MKHLQSLVCQLAVFITLLKYDAKYNAAYNQCDPPSKNNLARYGYVGKQGLVSASSLPVMLCSRLRGIMLQ